MNFYGNPLKCVIHIPAIENDMLPTEVTFFLFIRSRHEEQQGSIVRHNSEDFRDNSSPEGPVALVELSRETCPLIDTALLYHLNIPKVSKRVLFLNTPR